MPCEVVKDYGWKDTKTCSYDYLKGKVEKILYGIAPSKSARILDVGCGGGQCLYGLHRHGYRNIWGFDVSVSGIEIARSHFKEIGERFEIHDSYDHDLPGSFPQKDYDAVISLEVIEHLYSPHTYLKNINYWLKEGSYLILSTPYHGYLKNLAIAIFDGFDRHVAPLWEGGHVKFFSKNTLFNILRETGFHPVEFYGAGRMPFLWKSMIVVARKR